MILVFPGQVDCRKKIWQTKVRQIGTGNVPEYHCRPDRAQQRCDSAVGFSRFPGMKLHGKIPPEDRQARVPCSDRIPLKTQGEAFQNFQLTFTFPAHK